jgi:hypothetical protein
MILGNFVACNTYNLWTHLTCVNDFIQVRMWKKCILDTLGIVSTVKIVGINLVHY